MAEFGLDDRPNRLDYLIQRYVSHIADAGLLEPPDTNELRLLPSLSLVAFAARCSRRLLPLAIDRHERRWSQVLVEVGEKIASGHSGQDVSIWDQVSRTAESPAGETFAKTSAEVSPWPGVVWNHLAQCLQPFFVNDGVGSERVGNDVLSAVTVCEVYTLQAFLMFNRESPWAVEELRLDYNELHRRYRGSYRERGPFVDVSESGPFALPLWTSEMPLWYLNGIVREAEIPGDAQLASYDFAWNPGLRAYQTFEAFQKQRLQSDEPSVSDLEHPKVEGDGEEVWASAEDYRNLLDFLNNGGWWEKADPKTSQDR